MRYVTLALFTIVCSVPSPAADDVAAKELGGLQGTWRIVSCEYRGQKMTGLPNTRYVFQGNKIKAIGMDGVSERTFQLDPGKNPKRIDLQPWDRDTVGGAKIPTSLGIYSVEGNTLKLCWDNLGVQRPNEFSTQSKSGILILLVLKRE